jgi:hypothetical protein
MTSAAAKKIFSEPLPKYAVKSKVGSKDNIKHKPQGGRLSLFMLPSLPVQLICMNHIKTTARMVKGSPNSVG